MSRPGYQRLSGIGSVEGAVASISHGKGFPCGKIQPPALSLGLYTKNDRHLTEDVPSSLQARVSSVSFGTHIYGVPTCLNGSMFARQKLHCLLEFHGRIEGLPITLNYPSKRFEFQNIRCDSQHPWWPCLYIGPQEVFTPDSMALRDLQM